MVKTRNDREMARNSNRISHQSAQSLLAPPCRRLFLTGAPPRMPARHQRTQQDQSRRPLLPLRPSRFHGVPAPAYQENRSIHPDTIQMHLVVNVK